MLVFNVIVYNFNTKKFEPYNIFTYLEREYEKDLSKNLLKDMFRDKLKKWILDKSQYMFWSRCEYEVILSPWPPNENVSRKIDVFEQIEMNIEVITDMFYNYHKNEIN